MSETATAKLFTHDGHQAVSLPEDFQMDGQEVRVRRVGRTLVLEPIVRTVEDLRTTFEEIDKILAGSEFLPEGRPEQPPMPPDDEVSID